MIPKMSASAAGHVERYGMVIGLQVGQHLILQGAPRRRLARRPGRDQGVPFRNSSIISARSRRASTCCSRHFDTGDDFEADMARMAADPETQRWWKETDPCQSPIATRRDKEFWSRMGRSFPPD